jgi:hypothetical protein
MQLANNAVKTLDTVWLSASKMLGFNKLHFVGKPQTKIRTSVDRFLATFDEPLEHELAGNLTLLDSTFVWLDMHRSKTACKIPLFKMLL